MRRCILTLLLSLVAGDIARGDWIFRPSYFTHNPTNGERVTQFAPEKAPVVAVDPTYQQSGYRHVRGALEVGGSFDYDHIVETWGRGDSIRPYGEWEYPFREGATPFGPWGNPRGPWSLPYSPWFNPYGYAIPPRGMPWNGVPYFPPSMQ